MEQGCKMIASRIEAVMNNFGCSQSKFALRCGIEKGHLSKMMNGHQTFSDKMLMRIANAYEVSFDWLRDGTGEMLKRDKAKADAQYKATKGLVDATNGTVASNTINGDHNTGTQTINAANIDAELLRQRVEMLERLIEEKDKQITDKDNYINALISMLGKGVLK